MGAEVAAGHPTDLGPSNPTAPAFHAVLRSVRSRDRDRSVRPVRSRVPPPCAAHLYRSGNQRAARGRGAAADADGAAIAPMHVRHLVWATRVHGLADFGG